MSPLIRRGLILFCLVAAATFVRLGWWQLGRLEERRAANRKATAARTAPPVVLEPNRARPDSLTERRVIAAGSYDPDHEMVLRGAAVRGVPGVTLVTPLRLRNSDTAVLVYRGFVPAPDAMTVEASALREPGELQVEGIAQPAQAGGGAPLEHGGRTTWARVDLDAMRSRIPYPVLPVVLRQSASLGQVSFPRRQPPPPLDDGPHLGYAVQWFLFAGFALGFAWLVGRRPTPDRSAP
jgi:surfeit locus 1 family protein